MKRISSLKNSLSLLIVITCAGFISCDSASKGTAQNTDSTAMAMAEAVVSGTGSDTTVTGQVNFQTQGNGQVRMMLNLTIPTKANSSVAVHLHEHGDCGEMGNNAHGHWNPTNENHGKWGEGNYHSGDIGNVELDAQGTGSMELTTDRWTIGGDSTTNILNKAVIVHSGVDDYTSQPSGNAGSRIGCGVVNQANQ